LPNILVLAPTSSFEVRETIKSLYKLEGPAYLRLDKSQYSDISKSLGFNFGNANTLREGASASLICAGGIMEEVIKAADELSVEGIQCRVISMHTIKPIDEKAIKLASEETGGIISIEENTIIINCTPLGTFPETQKCPKIPFEFLSSNHICYDLIYNPEKTKFLLEDLNKRFLNLSFCKNSSPINNLLEGGNP
jgi:hypothetical protein